LYVGGVRGDRGHHRGPGQPMVASGVHQTGAPVCDRRATRRAQPGGPPVPGWHRRRLVR
jgi:hypothetical protein